MTIVYLDEYKKVLGVSANTRKNIDRNDVLDHFRMNDAIYYARIKGYLYTASDIYAGRRGLKEVTL